MSALLQNSYAKTLAPSVSIPLKSADYTEDDRASASSVPAAPAGAALAAKGGGDSSSSVSVDMESADVQAERARVAALTSLDQQCIVMQDLRKVYPAQVPSAALSQTSPPIPSPFA